MQWDAPLSTYQPTLDVVLVDMQKTIEKEVSILDANSSILAVFLHSLQITFVVASSCFSSSLDTGLHNVFDDDSQVIRFKNNLQEFADDKVDSQSHDNEEGEFKEAELLNDNKLPGGLVPLDIIISLNILFT
jgi:hypothetical protein